MIHVLLLYKVAVNALTQFLQTTNIQNNNLNMIIQILIDKFFWNLPKIIIDFANLLTEG